MAHAARLQVPFSGQRPPLGNLKLFHRVAAEIVKPIGKFRLDPWKKRVAVAKQKLSQQRLLVERLVAGASLPLADAEVDKLLALAA